MAHSDHIHLSSAQNTSLWFHNHIFLFLKHVFSAVLLCEKDTVTARETVSMEEAEMASRMTCEKQNKVNIDKKRKQCFIFSLIFHF